MPSLISPAKPAWRWVPTAYLAQGVPFAMVLFASATLLKDLNYPDAKIIQATASITIVWAVKPLYAGFLDLFGTKRFWVLGAEFLMALLLGACSLALFLPDPFWVLIGLLWAVALASAVQDICIDGVYITSLHKQQQAAWVGWAGAAWNSGRILATAAVVGAASFLQRTHGYSPQAAWAAAWGLAALCMAGLGVYHAVYLPPGSRPTQTAAVQSTFEAFLEQWRDLLRRPQIWGMLMFALLYRSGENFLTSEVPLFMQASTAHGGLGMCATKEITAGCPYLLSDKALIDGLLSTVSGAIFGILGGVYLGRTGLNRKTLVFMACCINVPHVTLIILSQLAQAHVVPLSTIAALVTIEKAGFSFGVVANMAYIMQQFAPGRHYMTHYAFGTALMQLLAAPIGALSGPLATALGYQGFFVFAFFAAIPSLIAAACAPFPNGSTPASRDAAAVTSET